MPSEKRSDCFLSLTLMVFVVVDLLHVFVNLSTLTRWNVRGGLFALVDEFFKQGVDLTTKSLPIQSTLHFCPDDLTKVYLKFILLQS